jgi:hypothetical protein
MTTGNMNVGFDSARAASSLLDEDFGADLRELVEAGSNADTYIDCDPANMTCPPKRFTLAQQSNPATLWSVASEALMSVAIMSSLRSTFTDYGDAKALMLEGQRSLDEAIKLLGSGGALTEEDRKSAADAALRADRYFKLASERFRILAASQDDRVGALEMEVEAAKAAVAGFTARAFLADERVSHGGAADEAQDTSQTLRELKQLLDRTIPNGLTVERQSLMEQLKIRVVFLKKAEQVISAAILKKGLVGRDIAGIVLQRAFSGHVEELIGKIPLALADSDRDYVLERISFALDQEDNTQKLAVLSGLFTDIGLASSYEDFVQEFAFSDDAVESLIAIGVPEKNIKEVQEIAERECLRLATPAILIDSARQLLLLTKSNLQVDYYQSSLKSVSVAERMLRLASRSANGDIILWQEIQRQLVFASELKSQALTGLQRPEEAAKARKETVSLLMAYAEDVTNAANLERFPDASPESLRQIAAEAALLRARAYYAVDRNQDTSDTNIAESIEAEERAMEEYIKDESNSLSERAGFLSQWADALRKAAEEFKGRSMQEKADIAYIKASEAHNVRAGLIENQGGERGEKLSFRDHAEIGYSLTAAADFLGKVSPVVNAEAATKFNESRWAMYSHASTAFYRAGRALSSDSGQHSPEVIHSLHLTWAYASLRNAQHLNGEAISTDNAIKTIIEAIRLTGDSLKQNVLTLQGETFTLDGLLTEALGLVHAGSGDNEAVKRIVSRERAVIYIGLVVEDDLVTEEGREALRELFKEAGIGNVSKTEAEFTAQLREGRYDVALRQRGVSAVTVATLSRAPVRASETFNRRGWKAVKGLGVFGR